MLTAIIVSHALNAWFGADPHVRNEAEAKPGSPARFLTDIFPASSGFREAIDLNGNWSFLRDPDDRGERESWYMGQAAPEGSVRIPGAPQAQGYGDPHPHQRTCFMTPFWVWRTFTVRELAPRERLWLRLGGVLPAARVYLNGRYVGYTKSSRTPQRVDVTSYVHAGENRIAVHVCDFPEVRLDGLLEWNEGTQHWTGLYRPVSCEITDRVAVVDAYLQPRLAQKAVDFEVELTESAENPLVLDITVREGKTVKGFLSVDIPAGQRNAGGSVPVENYVSWSPEHPQLYFWEVSVRENGGVLDRVALRFGMREFRTEQNRFYLNGKPFFWRVFGDDMYFPDTLCPPADKDWYAPRLRRARAYGMNGVKGCVETIPVEYLEAADEAGILVIQEMPFGLSTLREKRHHIDESFRAFFAEELDGLIRASRNHASVVAYSMSSELEYAAQTQESFDFFSRSLPMRTRELAPHALVIDCTGYVNSQTTDKGTRITDFYASIHPQWSKEVLEEADMESDGKHPLILHEYNWWSCYPDPADRVKYDRAQLIPFWLDGLIETAERNGQAHLIPTYRKNSLWLQTIARKDGIEYARRNPGVEGYILWLLIDFGHWSEGLLDDFWNPKNVSPAEFLQSNGETVVLLAVEGNRSLRMDEICRIPLAVSHYGETDYPAARLRWEMTGPSGIRDAGQWIAPHLEEGALTPIGEVIVRPPARDAAYKLSLNVALESAEGAVINTNTWSFWAFPPTPEEIMRSADPARAGTMIRPEVFLRIQTAAGARIPEDAAVVVADAVDTLLAECVRTGGICLLFSRAAVIENRTPYHGDRTFYGIYRTIPWNAGAAGNSGTVIADHPALARFPHEGYCDLCWVWLLRGFYPIEFEPLRPHGVQPIIRNIDSYRSNRNNAFMLEFRVGNGKVLATTVGVLPNLAERIEAQYLFSCLLDYVRSDAFQPKADVPADVFFESFRPKPGGFTSRSSVDRNPD